MALHEENLPKKNLKMDLWFEWITKADYRLHGLRKWITEHTKPLVFMADN